MPSSLSNQSLVAIIGPTASGKTSRAVSLAKHIGAEIVSCDSRQIYTGMDLGTGKDLAEYGDVPYHLIDIRPAGYKYNLHEYLTDYDMVAKDIQRREKRLVLCGGTGMYAEAVLSGMKLPAVPENPTLRAQLADKSIDELKTILETYKSLHNTTDLDSAKRAIRAIEIQEYYSANPDAAVLTRPDVDSRPKSVIIGIDIPRDARRRRISDRLRERLNNGMLDEVRRLLSMGVKAEDLMYYGLEYKYLTLYVIGEISYESMFSQLETAIHQFAKRQMTWFRGMERRGFIINWLPYDMSETDFLGSCDSLINNL